METVRSQSKWLGPLVQDDHDDEGDDIFAVRTVIIMIAMGVNLFLFGITDLLLMYDTRVHSELCKQ